MSIPQLTTNLNIIQALDNLPNDVTGLTPAQLKAKFDEAVNIIKAYINNSLLATLHSTTLGSSGSEEIASPTIAGITGNTIYSQIYNLLSLEQSDKAYLLGQMQGIVLGTVSDGSITDIKLSNVAGSIKKINRSRIASVTVSVDTGQIDFISLPNFDAYILESPWYDTTGGSNGYIGITVNDDTTADYTWSGNSNLMNNMFVYSNNTAQPYQFQYTFRKTNTNKIVGAGNVLIVSPNQLISAGNTVAYRNTSNNAISKFSVISNNIKAGTKLSLYGYNY